MPDGKDKTSFAFGTDAAHVGHIFRPVFGNLWFSFAITVFFVSLQRQIGARGGISILWFIPVSGPVFIDAHNVSIIIGRRRPNDRVKNTSLALFEVSQASNLVKSGWCFCLHFSLSLLRHAAARLTASATWTAIWRCWRGNMHPAFWANIATYPNIFNPTIASV